MKFEVHCFHRDVCTDPSSMNGCAASDQRDVGKDPSLMNGCAAGDHREEAGGSLFCSKSQAF